MMTNENQPNPDNPLPADPAAAPASNLEPPRSDEPAVGRKRWIAAAAAALGVALFAVPLLRGPDDHSSTSVRTGDPQAAGTTCAAKGTANFDFTLKDANGANVKLTDYKGKVVLLNFWATWCGPCKLEIPEFVEAYQHYRDKGFVILGVLSEDDPSSQDLRAFMTDFKMNYPVFRQHEGLDAAFGPLWGLPTTFIIDRQGAICTKHMGPVSREMLDREIKGLL
jgi:peroxiredoxin